MQIFQHKGNTPAIFGRSLAAGFGVELDVRDLGQTLVVSHDPPRGRPSGLERFFEIYASLGSRLPLALNIKSCGLADKLAGLACKFKVRNYFVFDLAVPDALSYLKLGIAVFTRQSEYEPVPAFYDKAAGVWLDEFRGHWIVPAAIRAHLGARKKICVVSPELHKRSFEKEWAGLKRLQKTAGPGRLMLCTDHPLRARRYFNEQN